MDELKLKNLLVAIIIAATALFVAGEVMAFNDNENIVDWEGVQFPAGKYTVQLNSITEISGSCETIDDIETCDYEWNYTFNTGSANLSGTNFVAMFLPDCENSPKITVYETQCTPPSTFSDPGEGESTLGFGEFNVVGRVLKRSSDNTNSWIIVTNTNSVTSVAAVIKAGNKNKTFGFRMPGPGCTELPCVPELPPVRVEPVTQCYEFTAENQGPNCPNGPYSVWVIETDRDDKCKVTGVWQKYYDTSPEDGCSDVLTSPVPGEDLNALLKFDDGTIPLSEDLPSISTILAVDECDVGWVQALDESDCNARCYKIAGRLYCR